MPGPARRRPRLPGARRGRRQARPSAGAPGPRPAPSYRDHVDEGGLARVLQPDQRELHLLLPEQGLEPVQQLVEQSDHGRCRRPCPVPAPRRPSLPRAAARSGPSPVRPGSRGRCGRRLERGGRRLCAPGSARRWVWPQRPPPPPPPPPPPRAAGPCPARTRARAPPSRGAGGTQGLRGARAGGASRGSQPSRLTRCWPRGALDEKGRILRLSYPGCRAPLVPLPFQRVVGPRWSPISRNVFQGEEGGSALFRTPR